MKDRFIRVISPITLAFALALDAGTVYFLTLAIPKLIAQQSLINFAFVAIVLVVLVVAVLVTKTVVTAGVRFSADSMEFTAIDNDNVFSYKDIEGVETKRDDKASLTKNFDDRHSYILLRLKDEKLATIDLGLTTKSAVVKIEAEIKSRI